MQQVKSDAGAARAEETRGPVSPPVAFALLFVVVLALGLMIFLLRPDSTGTSETTPPITKSEPSFELTNAEAIARFEELNEMRFSIYEDRDVSLIDSVLTAGSPLRTRAHREIGRLIRDDVTVKMNFETLEISVVRNGEDEIVLRQVVREAPRFLSASGKDITTTKPQIKTVKWFMWLENGAWKIHHAVTLAAHRA